MVVVPVEAKEVAAREATAVLDALDIAYGTVRE